MQADSIIPDQTNPQSWNRYSYVENDPINYSDASGHFKCKADGSVSAETCQEDVEALLTYLQENGGEEGQALVEAFRAADTRTVKICGGRGGGCNEIQLKNQVTITIGTSETMGGATGNYLGKNKFTLNQDLFKGDMRIAAGTFGHEIQHFVQERDPVAQKNGKGFGSLYGEIDAYDMEWRLYQNMGLKEEEFEKMEIAADIASYRNASKGAILSSGWANSLGQYDTMPLYSYWYSSRVFDDADWSFFDGVRIPR